MILTRRLARHIEERRTQFIDRELQEMRHLAEMRRQDRHECEVLEHIRLAAKRVNGIGIENQRLLDGGAEILHKLLRLLRPSKSRPDEDGVETFR